MIEDPFNVLIREDKGIQNILEAKIEDLENEKEKKLERLNESFVDARIRPISVSHIQII